MAKRFSYEPREIRERENEIHFRVVQKIVESKLANLIEDAACERCGSFDAIEFAGKILCADCVALAGCACAGHGADDEA